MKLEVIFTAFAFVLLSLIARFSQTLDDVKLNEIAKPQSLSTSLPQSQPEALTASSLRPLTK